MHGLGLTQGKLRELPQLTCSILFHTKICELTTNLARDNVRVKVNLCLVNPWINLDRELFTLNENRREKIA